MIIFYLPDECFQGEEYKLFWPAQPEFVRMAAKFGAKIVPFASVGEDDLGEVSIHSSRNLIFAQFSFFTLLFHSCRLHASIQP